MATKRKKGKTQGSTKPFRPEELEIDFVILADAAQVVGGKLYVMGGGWNVYHATQYPLNIPFSVAIGILVPWSETNRKHRFEFTILASEGAILGKGEGDFEVGRKVGIKAGMTQRMTLAVSGQLGIPAPGTYEIIVTIPGREKRISFEALSIQPTPQVTTP